MPISALLIYPMVALPPMIKTGKKASQDYVFFSTVKIAVHFTNDHLDLAAAASQDATLNPSSLSAFYPSRSLLLKTPGPASFAPLPALFLCTISSTQVPRFHLSTRPCHLSTPRPPRITRIPRITRTSLSIWYRCTTTSALELHERPDDDKRSSYFYFLMKSVIQ